jgi:AraC-like DNA-binding protein
VLALDTGRTNGRATPPFETDSPERGRQRLSRIFKGPVRQAVPEGHVYGLSHAEGAIGNIGFHVLEHRGTCGFELKGGSWVGVGHVNTGSIERASRDAYSRLEAGSVFLLGQPFEPSRIRTAGAVVTLTVIGVDQLAGALHRSRPESGPELRFDTVGPVAPELGQAWGSLVDDLRRLPIDQDGDPAVARAAEELLLAVFASMFPSNWSEGRELANRPPASSTLRRAIAYIDDHADSEMSVDDLARAAGVSARAVQLAFRRHLKTTPMAYLRQVRLARAHDDLAAAELTSGETVASVAANWGFYNAGRFATMYRNVYGCRPRATLKAGAST